jgi:hypothetical protein
MREHAAEHMAGVIRRFVGELPAREAPATAGPIRIDIEGA